MELIWVRREAKYFCKWGWTSHFGKHEVICPSGKISRTVIPRESGYPVRRTLSIDHGRLWNTGSPAFAGDDGCCQSPLGGDCGCTISLNGGSVAQRSQILEARRRAGPDAAIIESRLNLRTSATVPCAGSVRLSQKSYKAAVLLGITLLCALSLPDRREGGSDGSRYQGRWSSPRVVQNS